MPMSESLLPSHHVDRREYLEGGGYLALRYAHAEPGRAREALLATPLTGLGGAHFPFTRKLASTLAAPGPRVVVCNAAEDEPGSKKDRMLMSRNPHLILEGAMIAAAVLDAHDIIIYVSELAEDEHASVVAAIDDIRDNYALGPRLRIFRASRHYVSGEATAAIDAINGGPGKPTGHPPYPTEKGVDGLPTVVANCETLANLPRIILAAWAGVQPRWTRLATISGDIATPGVYEIDPTADTFADLIARAGDLTGSGCLKAFQPGGPSSRFLTADDAATLIDNAAIRTAGSQPGCLAIRVFATSSCIVEVCEEITGFFAREQCGQCPPCRMKTQTYHRTIQQLGKSGGGKELLSKLAVVDDFVADMPHRCSLIDMPTSPVDSARQLFPDDFSAHIDNGQCAVHEPTPSPR